MINRRLGYNKTNNTYFLTVPSMVAVNKELKAGMPFYFREIAGIFYFDREGKGKKIKLQYQKANNTFFVRVPAAIVGHLKYVPRQLFNFDYTTTSLIYNPLNGKQLIGVGEKRGRSEQNVSIEI